MPEITFGKHKGREFNDPEIQTSYLEYLLRSQLETIQDIEAELARREQAEANDVPLAERMIIVGFRALCEEYGDDERMLHELKGTRAVLEQSLAQYFEEQVKIEVTRRMDAASEKRRQILKWKQGS